MSEDVKELPEGWAWSTFGALLPLQYGKALRKDKRDESGQVPVFGSSGMVGFHDEAIAPPRCILVGRKGSAGSVYYSEQSSWPIDTVYFSEVSKLLNSQYWFHRLSFERLVKLDQSTAIPSLSRDNYSVVETSVPPLAEQERIVDKIDELFSAIEAGERAIEQARAGVARYRKAILKAAVTGELTRDWREQNLPQAMSGVVGTGSPSDIATHKQETAEALLARILKARYAAWEKAELDKLTAKGKPHPQTEKQWEKFRGRYKEPVAPDTEGLPDLPEGWIWASLDGCTTKITSGSRDWKKYYDNGTSVFLMAQNIRPRKLDLTFIQNVDPPEGNSDAIRSEVHLDDILITIVGANTGDACRVPTDLPRHYVCQSVALLRPSLRTISQFLEFFISSGGAAGKQVDSYIYGAGRPHLSFEQLRMLAIPIVPLAEQTEIVNRVEQALSKADAVEATLDAQARQAKALKQSVLKTAFEGKLLPQNPNDEPASELLKRIKAAS